MAMREKQSEEQRYKDLRVMTLKRYNTPLTYAEMCRETNGNGIYLSLKNYHFISIVPGQMNAEHPISNTYHASKNASEVKRHAQNTGTKQNVHVFQTMILFGDRPDFWETPSDLIYITMLQFTDNREVTLGVFQEQVRKACRKLQQKSKKTWCLSESDWCVYYTLDYSDAILFVRNCDYNRYQDLLWELTVSVKETDRLVIDTISLYGVNAQKVKEKFKKIQKGSGDYSLQPLKNTKDSFDLTLFLGVQNAEKWNEVQNKLINEYRGDLRFYRKFGRTDITVTFRSFDLEKSLYLVWLLFFDKSTKPVSSFESCVIAPRSKLLKSNSESTSVKKNQKAQNPSPIIQNPNSKTQYPDDNKQTPDQIVGNALLPLYQDADSQLKKLYLPLSGYCTELYQSLLALLHSSFAEEYYLSVLPSFAAHLKMFGDEIKKQESIKQQPEREVLVDELREYYRCLIMLEHSTLHGEKKFIQAPGLNAFICEVPAKLLVFYTAVAFRIIRRLQDSAPTQDAAPNEDLSFFPEAPHYIPLLIPDFRPDMYTRHILDKQGGQMQIGIICMEEQLFYEPEYTIPSMVHEIAHRVGDEARQRELRLKIIFRCLSVYLICSVLPKDLFETESKLQEAAEGIDRLAEVMADQYVQQFRNESPDVDTVPYLARVQEFLQQTGAGRVFLDKSDEREFVEELVEKWQSAFNDSKYDVLLPLLDLEDRTCITMFYHSVTRNDPRRPMVETTFFYSLLDRIVFPETSDEESKELFYFWDVLLKSFSEAYSDLRMLETVDNLNYPDIMNTMFQRKDVGDIGNRSELKDLIQRYDLRAVPVCRALDREKPNLKREFQDKRTKFIIEKAQDGMVEYLKACRQNTEPDERISAFVQSGGDIIMIRDEIALYRERLLQFFKRYKLS